MSRRWRIAALAAIALCPVLASAGAAQVINFGAVAEARPNFVHARTGVEYGFITGFGYSRVIGLGSRTLLLSGTLTAPWARADAADYHARIGAAVRLVSAGRWQLIGGLNGSVRGMENRVSRMTSLGAGGMLLGGIWSPRWFVAVEGGYDGAIATRVRHSEYYRAIYYADARDGWYADTGANINAGVAGGISFGRYDLILRAGQARDRGGRMQSLPAYATVDLNVRF